ncbi:MAG TPA: serine hydrolase domain-containing protein [Polyangia bacterium]|nr:serine hydrolase domain-containing protein [Polyangia bacterium]
MQRRDFTTIAGWALAAAPFAGCLRRQRRETKINPLHDQMAARIARDEFPGAVWLVAQGDDVAVEAVGLSAVGGKLPMRRDSIFRIASMTKAVTATAVMMLIQEGKLRLDGPVQQWLPELANRRVLRRLDGPLTDTVPAGRAITVEDLLTFTMGFGMQFDNRLPIQRAIDENQLCNGPPVPMTPLPPDEWMRRFGTLPLMHQPGEGWMYNTGSLIQGVLVRRAANQPFDDFVRERITGPLGMRDTDFFVPAPKLERYAGCGLSTNPASKARTRMDQDGAASAYASPPVFPGGAAGLVSTVDDYLAFARMLLNGGVHHGRRLLAETSVRAMTTDHITAAQKAAARFFPGFFEKSGWGYGMRVSTAPDAITPVPGRYGWDGGFGTSWISDAHRNLIAIVMTQSSDFLFNGGIDAFWRGVYAAAA